MRLDIHQVNYWRQKGWIPREPAEWTLGADGREYRVWVSIDPKYFYETRGVGYLDCPEGPMKPMGPLLVIAREAGKE